MFNRMVQKRIVQQVSKGDIKMMMDLVTKQFFQVYTLQRMFEFLQFSRTKVSLPSIYLVYDVIFKKKQT